MPRQSKSKIINRYVMHTDAPDVRKDNRRAYQAQGEEWDPPVKHPEGVTEHRHEEGSALFVTHARTIGQARKKIDAVGSRKEKEAGDWLDSHSEPIYHNPKYAFSPENKGKVKPTVVKGDKDE